MEIQMAEIVIQSLLDVVIDGQSVGCVADAFANYRDQSAEIFDALMKWDGAYDDVSRSAMTEAVAAKESELQKVIDELKSNHKGAEEAFQRDLGIVTQVKDGFRSQAEAWKSQCEQVVEANGKLQARLKEVEASRQAMLNLVNAVLLESTDQAIVAARELDRLDALQAEAAAKARVAAHHELKTPEGSRPSATN
jgi:hypothetical protein